MAKGKVKDKAGGIAEELEQESKRLIASRGLALRMYSDDYRNAEMIYINDEMYEGGILTLEKQDEMYSLGDPFVVADGKPLWLLDSHLPFSIELDLDIDHKAEEFAYVREGNTPAEVKEKVDRLYESSWWKKVHKQPVSMKLAWVLSVVCSFLVSMVVFLPMEGVW